MGSKGSNTTTTNQNQTYNPAGGSYIQSALDRAGQTANLPFNIPQAPVAGFSQDQQSGFQGVRNAQGMAQPYYNQASNLFNRSAQGPDISQFFNPYASAVTAQMNNIFGQQNAQNTGNLVQSAGGVGADRIAVGQANMANQQGLAAGQTMASLYAPSLQAAQQQQNIEQGAAYGQSALGSASQNAAFSGANALLGTGSLQQQLSQAQLNSPYQQQLAQAAFPYQQSQFYTGAVGSLAPGLGGTTSGTGTTSTPAPSMWSQLLGLGTAGVGAAGAAGVFNGGSGYQNSTGNYMGMSDAGQDALQDAGYPLPSARGGAIHPYARGGYVHEPYYDDGGAIPNDEPIDVSAHPFIPTGQTQAIQPHVPQINLAPPQKSQGNGGPSTGDIANMAKMAMMFAARGGRINHPYADGGEVDNGIDISDHGEAPYSIGQAIAYAHAKQDGTEVESGRRFSDDGWRIPGRQKARNDVYTEGLRHRARYADGGDTTMDDRFGPVKDALASGDFDAAGANSTTFEGTPGLDAANRGLVPTPRPRPSRSDAGDGSPALAFAGSNAGTAGLPPEIATGASNPYAATSDAKDMKTASEVSAADTKKESFIDSPWAALMAAGLGIAGGTSPYAAVNIGQGGMQGLKTLEAQRAAGQRDTTIAQAAKRLEQEAKFHEDTFSRMTMGQKLQEKQANRPYQELTAAEKQSGDLARARDERADRQFNRPYEELTAAQRATIDRQKEQDDLAERRFNRPYQELTMQEQAQLEESKRQHDLSRVPQGYRTNAEGNLEPVPGGPHSTDQIRAEADAKRLPAMADEDLRPMIDTYKAGNTAGVLTSISRGAQGSANIQRFWHLLAQDLVNEGASGKDLAAAKANFMAQSAGARTSAVREANIETAVNEAKGTFPEVLRTSAALPRTDWTPVNAALEFYRQKSGSPEQRQFGAAIQAAVTAYSQAMSRTGANSVYAQQHAAEILSHTDGPEALKASIDQLNTEMAIAQHAPEQTRQGILNRILGIKEPAAAGAPPAAATPAGPAAVVRPASLPEGSQYSASRRMWRTPDGKMFDASGNPVQ